MMESSNSNNDKLFDNVTADQWIRGKTPENIEARALELCHAYLGGSWSNATTTEQITVTRLTGGLTNQLFRVELNDSVPRVKNQIYENEEPTKVVIKLFMSKYCKTQPDEVTNERLDDVIVLTILSETGIGPKVYGIFNDGFIQEHLEHEQFGLKHQKQPELIVKLAQLLAQIHYLKVPMRKNDIWPIDETGKFLESSYSDQSILNLIDEFNLPTLKSIDLRVEFEQIKKWAKQVKSSLVFSHNDYFGTNIMVLAKSQKLVAIDLEYSAYNGRAFDIAVFYAQWGLEPTDFDNINLPEDSILEHFCALYIEACEKLIPGYSQNPDNSVTKIVTEVKVYMLAYFVYIMSFTMNQPQKILETLPYTPETNMRYVEKLLKRYLEIKERLIKDGTIKI